MTVIDTPEGIQFAKLCALRGAVKMELRGMRRRGRSATVLAKELLGLQNSTSREKTLEALNREINRLKALHEETKAREAEGYQLVELDSIGGAKLEVWYKDMHDNQRYMEACERGKLDV